MRFTCVNLCGAVVADLGDSVTNVRHTIGGCCVSNMGRQDAIIS